jgi:hypothetical protein
MLASSLRRVCWPLKVSVEVACLQGVLPYELIPWPIGPGSPRLLRDASTSHRREIHQLKGLLVPSGTKAPESERMGLPWTAADASVKQSIHVVSYPIDRMQEEKLVRWGDRLHHC